jgi:transposase
VPLNCTPKEILQLIIFRNANKRLMQTGASISITTKLERKVHMGEKLGLGLDVDKATIKICLLRSGDKRGSTTLINNSIAGGQKLLTWLHGVDLADVHVCLEPTGKYSRVIAAFLHEAGLKVSQVHSYAVVHHGRSKNYRNKTDRIDAYLLADYCLKENPPTWEPAAPSQAELAELQSRIYDIDEMLRQEKNRLAAGGMSSFVQQDIKEHIAHLLVRKEALEEATKDLVQKDALLSANFKIISSIIGLGDKSSLSLLSAVRFERFAKPRSVGCFAGLTPQKYESGTSVRMHECISRKGSSKLRERLYFPAMVAMQHNPQMRAVAERMKALQQLHP